MRYINEEIIKELTHKKNVVDYLSANFPVLTKSTIMLSDREEARGMINYLIENFDFLKPETKYHDSQDFFPLRKFKSFNRIIRFDDPKTMAFDIFFLRELVPSVRSVILQTNETLAFWSSVNFKVPSARSESIYKSLEKIRIPYPNALNAMEKYW